MEALINFAYTGKVTIFPSNVQALLVGASYLNLKVGMGRHRAVSEGQPLTVSAIDLESGVCFKQAIDLYFCL